MSRLVERLTARMHPRLAAPLGSLLVTARRREPCLVQADEGGWVHRYREGITVHPRLGGASARLQDRAARDHFLYDYEPRPGDVVFDIGAGVGGEVRLFSRLVGPVGRVVSVEAHPITYGHLARTVALNRLANVMTLQVAVTDARGTVFITDDSYGHVANGVTPDESAGVPVAGRTLADIIELAGVDRIDLLKMNIEGSELATLRSAGDALAYVRHIVVSCHDFRGQPTYDGVSAILRTAGFTLRTRPADARPWIQYYLYGTRT